MRHHPSNSGRLIDEAVNSPARFEAARFEAASWGMNSGDLAQRAKKILGWMPQERSLDEELPEIVRSEAVRMGL
ncbi:hypothetical protein BJY04DRAFT_199156 [Aspergillus karnatakaensis]|uniref:uncharacterized protein n=1 Tax=Aspergillus karnatakaensis TaxID=1810916 RepID=UPI003CCCCD45